MTEMHNLCSHLCENGERNPSAVGRQVRGPHSVMSTVRADQPIVLPRKAGPSVQP